VIVYQANKSRFLDDALKRDIDEIILEAYTTRTGGKVGKSEIGSWRESLLSMAKVLNDDQIPDDVGVAIEYKIPQTAKRVDFIITGADSESRPNLIIVELKQWAKASLTDKDGVISTSFARGPQEVSHPSYQAWSYAALLNGFNQAVYDGGIELQPCAYLHNYVSDGVIDNDRYQHYIKKAPLFLKGEQERAKLREFIKRYVKHGDKAGLLYKIENGRVRPSKMLVDSLARMMKGNQEFVLIDDQKVVYESALAIAKQATDKNKQVFIVEGGPGTGKSVIAINLLVALSKLGLTSRYVSKNAAPRAVYESKLTGVLRKTEISNLFSGSGAFVDAEPNEFDVLIVDEAHRLNEKSGLYGNLGENQIKELINAAKCVIFFIDEDQVVTLKDIGHKDEIRRWARQLDAKVSTDELSSQFRCNGSDGYLAWLDNALQIRPTANDKLDPSDFDFRIFDSPEEMRKAIVEKNKASNRARMVSGYCWPWNSKKDSQAMDVVIPEHKFAMQWNLSSDGSLWIVAKNSVDEIGCIHTCQGLEVDYIGVVVGDDFTVRDGKAVAQPEKRATADQSVKGYKSAAKAGVKDIRERADRIVKNTYRTLMTRGLKGCYVYFTDKQASEYFRSLLEAAPPISAVANEKPPAFVEVNPEPFRRLRRSEAKPYQNCVPLVDLKFAAGAFSDTQTIDESEVEWIELPEGFKAQPGLFVAQVIGESMNRRIPNGAWCLFKSNPVGTRQGKVIVAQHRGIHDPECAAGFTVKVYESEKRQVGDSWTHTVIRLRPDSTDASFQPITVDGAGAATVRIVAELVAVIS
jgi:DUF2075 family protein